MGYAFSPCPTTKPLENLFYPNGQTIASKACEMVEKISGWMPDPIVATEIEEFKGPF
jgi:pyruvate dehydrogenase E1 component beta subunit